MTITQTRHFIEDAEHFTKLAKDHMYTNRKEECRAWIHDERLVKLRGADYVKALVSKCNQKLHKKFYLQIEEMPQVTEETEQVIESQEAAIEAATEKEEEMSNNEISVKTYRYGMQHRGFSPGCQPKGVVGREDDPSGLFYDIINYEKPLSWKDCQDYELTPIDHVPEGMPTEEAEEEATEPEVVIEETAEEAAIETPAEDPNAAKMAALTARCGQGFKCVGLDVGRFREKVFAVDIDGYTVTLRFAPESRAKKLGHHVLTAIVERDGQKELVKDIGKPQARRDYEYQIKATRTIKLDKLIEKAREQAEPVKAEAAIETSAPVEIVSIEEPTEAPIETPKKEAPIKNGEKFDGLFENAWFEAGSMFVEYRNAPLVGKECAAFAAAMQVLGHIGEGGATPPAPIEESPAAIEEPQETTEEAPVEEAPAYVAAAKVDTQEARSSIDPAVVEAVQEASESTEEPQAEESPIEEGNAATEPQEAVYKYGFAGNNNDFFTEEERTELKEGKNVLRTIDGHYYLYLPVHIDNNSSRIYRLDCGGKGTVDPGKEPSGIGIIINGNYYKTDYETISEISEKLAQDIDARVHELIPDEETAKENAGELTEWDKRELHDTSYLTKSATRAFYNGENPKLHLYFREKDYRGRVLCYSLEVLMNYINSPVETVFKMAEEHVDKKKKEIYSSYHYYNRRMEALTAIQSDPNRIEHTYKAIMNSISDQKTLRILLTNGETVKVESRTIKGIGYWERITEYDVAAPDRKKMPKDEDGRIRNITVNDIVAIMYGSKELYRKTA